MDMVFLEVTDGLDGYGVSAWIPSSKILSFIVEHRPEDRAARLKVETMRIRGVSYNTITPWLNSLEEAESARRQVIRLLIDGQATQVIRWSGSAFVCEDR